MAIPKFYDLFNLTLEELSTGEELHRRELYRRVIARVDLTPEELAETSSQGGLRVFSRAGWAAQYLVAAGAATRAKRGYITITDLGRKLLADHPQGISMDVLRETEGLKAWSQRSRAKRDARGITTKGDELPLSDGDSGVTPIEELERSIATLREAVAAEILDRLRTEHWRFMEHAVLKVLLKMGYGGSEDDLSHVGGPNDEGIDGIINQDKLGLEKIYVQSKRYKAGSAISGDTINAFMGAMGRKGVTKGVFITASHFTDGARKAAEENKHQQVILIDGEELAEIMVDYQIGVTEVQTYTIYKLDENFFED